MDAETFRFVEQLQRTNDPEALIESLRCDRWRLVSRRMGELGIRVREVAYRGLADLDWRVRAGCADYMDHFADDRCIERLILVLHDPKRVVRHLATHAVGCHGCKPAPLTIDVVAPLIRRLDEDHSLKVRRMAALMLLFQPPERRITKRLHRLLREETDPRLHKHAGMALFFHQQGLFLDGNGTVRKKGAPTGSPAGPANLASIGNPRLGKRS